MALKVFILGRPGSGKSSVAQLVQQLAGESGWSVRHIYDYELLQTLFLQEIEKNIPLGQRRFKPRGPEYSHGFDVTDFTVLDVVLEQMVDKADEFISPGEKDLLLFEFARARYKDALEKFRNDLLQDAHILYIRVDMETCIERIHLRVGNGLQFSHFVSDNIMRQYYLRDDWLEGQCEEYLKLLESQGIRTYLQEIDNTGSFDQLRESVKEFVEKHLLRETEPLPAVQKKITQIESAK